MKKQKKALADRKSRDAKRKAKRLATKALTNLVGAARRRLRTDAPVVAVRRGKDREIVIGVRKGLMGHPGTVILRIDDVSIAGMQEDVAELAKFINNVGLLTVAQLFRHDLAQGIDGLAKSIATWAGVDLEALKATADAESGDTSTPQAEVPAPTPESISDFSPGQDPA
jgi:hypothetical protein